MAVVFKLPDLGENIESAEVVSVAAAVGDMIEAEQTIIEVETDKAVTDVPAPIGGKLLDLAVAVGDKLAVGDIIATIEEVGRRFRSPPPRKQDEPAAAAPPAARPRQRPSRQPPPEPAPRGRRRRASGGPGRRRTTDRYRPPRRSANSPAKSASTSATSPGRDRPAASSVDDVKSHSRRMPAGGGRGAGPQGAARFRQMG